jgi:hypothetical protein
MSIPAGPEPTFWQVDDVRGVWTVSTVGRLLVLSTCGFCGRPFQSAGWVRLSVARPGLGGTIVDLCAECSATFWESIAAHLAAVSEQLRLADALRARVGL